MVQVFQSGKLDLLGWLSSRYAGFQQALLFAPENLESEEERFLKVYEPRNPLKIKRGPSLVNAMSRRHAIHRGAVDIFNSSSFSTFTLLQVLSRKLPKGRKALTSPSAMPGRFWPGHGVR
jgi:hypothetical protein